MQQSDRHSADIKRDHVLSAGGAGMRQSQIDILQTSKEITYALQERGECSSQIDILQTSKEITYVLQEGGERSRVRSTFCRHQKRSRTPCRRGENAAESDRHSADIKRDHVRPAGGGRTQQSDRHSAGIKRDHVLPAGGEECSGVRSTFRSHQKRSRTGCRRGENAAVRSTFCRVIKRRSRTLQDGGERSSSEIDILQS
jgi:hypothetical protein